MLKFKADKFTSLGCLLKIICTGVASFYFLNYLYFKPGLHMNAAKHLRLNVLRSQMYSSRTSGVENFEKRSEKIFQQNRAHPVLSTSMLRNIIVHKEEDCHKRQFLIYKCSNRPCGGLGDREKGIVSSFLLALLTNRTFAIIIDKPCDIGNFMQPFKYDWQICKRYLSSLPNSKFAEVGHVYRNSEFLKEIPNIDFSKIWTKQVINLYMNSYESAMDGIKRHKDVGRQMKWIKNRTNPEIAQLVLRTLLAPKKRLSDHLKYFIGNITQDRKLICSHIRKGRNPSIPRDSYLRKGSPREKTIFSFLKQYKNVKQFVIYIATDSDGIKNIAKTNFRNFVNINRTIVHVDRYGNAKSFTDVCEGFYTVLFEQQLLSMCDVLVLTRSNFGTIAAYMRGSSEDLFLYQTDTDRVTPTNLTNIQTLYKFV